MVAIQEMGEGSLFSVSWKGVIVKALCGVEVQSKEKIGALELEAVIARIKVEKLSGWAFEDVMLAAKFEQGLLPFLEPLIF